jgi:hypothetical protein
MDDPQVMVLMNDLTLSFEALDLSCSTRDTRILHSELTKFGEHLDLLEDALGRSTARTSTGEASAAMWLIRLEANQLLAATSNLSLNWEHIGVLLSFAESGIQRLGAGMAT